MRKWLMRGGWRLVAVGSGIALALGGCDPQVKLAFENGFITASSSFLAAFLQAITALLAQQAASTTTTARIAVDVAGRIFA